MKKTIIILGSVVIVGLIAVGIFFGLNFSKNTNKPAATETTKKSPYDNITYDVLSEWSDKYRLSMMYPLTPNDRINVQARAEMDNYLNSFRQSLAKSADKLSRPLELNLNSDVYLNTENIINLAYSGKSYLGTTESDIRFNRIYDAKTGEQITTKDMFKSGDYLKSLSTEAREKLKTVLGQNYNTDTVNKGTSPVYENFDQFEIGNGNVYVIVFEPGQVAPTNLGAIRAELPVSGIENILSDKALTVIYPELVKAQETKQAQQDSVNTELSSKLAAAQPLATDEKTDCSIKKCIALTFNDGPSANTPKLLDILKQYNVKASFYVIGRQISGNEETLKRIASEGHDIGIQTWDHLDLAYANAENVQNQVDKTNQAIVGVVGKKSYMVRPPYGSFSNFNMVTNGLPYILWSVDPSDWKDKNTDVLYQKVMASAKTGAIVISHDTQSTTVEAYRRIIPDLISQGYSLVTVSDLVDIDAKNPTVKAYYSR